MPITIDAFPDEVLLIVFKLCAAELRRGRTYEVITSAGSDRSPRFTRLDIRPLLLLTHVCARWRAVALAHHSLWTRVDGNSVSQLETFSERAGTRPLSLFLGTWSIVIRGNPICGDIEVREFLRQHEQRLRRLDAVAVMFTNPTDCDAPAWMKDLNAPALECLNIALEYDEWEGLNFKETLLFGESLREHPALKALAITEMTGWIPANHFPNLTHLLLSFSFCILPVDETQFISLLGRMPNLEHLHLHRMVPLSGPSAVHVPLPRLRSLAITKCINTEEAPLILRRLVLPLRVLVRIREVDVELLDAATILVCVPSAVHATFLDIRVDNHRITIIAGTDQGGLWIDGLGEPVYRSDGLSDWAGTVLDGVRTKFSPQYLTSLLLDIPAWPNDGTVEQFIQWAAQVERLCLLLEERDLFSVTDEETMAENSKIRSLCDVLSRDHAESGIVCPALHTIQLISIVQFPENTAFIHCSAQQFKAMLSTRANRGFPIRHLEIQFINAELEEKEPWRTGDEDLEPLAELSGYVGGFVQVNSSETFPKPFVTPQRWQQTFEDEVAYWELGPDIVQF